MSTLGVWRTSLGEQPVSVKRLSAPGEHDPPSSATPVTSPTGAAPPTW
ncbi:hypothetical protein I601_3398 [Nocardioides dokdonensis FR1436]|uniref:Uncharacterized protein n=1 Tax=Nocardioides dokdonensis FR1436 TaxID=1300347 RepID=A0A1A9GNE1_9ACTN|nr:hypothetical protein I601_3398 [Nocardioides dokdonensis FR1436]